jgi:hypothetical protein
MFNSSILNSYPKKRSLLCGWARRIRIGNSELNISQIFSSAIFQINDFGLLLCHSVACS